MAKPKYRFDPKVKSIIAVDSLNVNSSKRSLDITRFFHNQQKGDHVLCDPLTAKKFAMILSLPIPYASHIAQSFMVNQPDPSITKFDQSLPLKVPQNRAHSFSIGA